MAAIAREMRGGFPNVRGERFLEMALERAWDDGKVIFAQPGEDHAVVGILENDVCRLSNEEEVEVPGVERPEVEVMGIMEGEEAIPHTDAEGAGTEILAGGFRVKDILPRFLVKQDVGPIHDAGRVEGVPRIIAFLHDATLVFPVIEVL